MQARRGPLLSILLLATGAAAVLAGCAARETTRERVFVPYDTSRTWTGWSFAS